MTDTKPPVVRPTRPGSRPGNYFSGWLPDWLVARTGWTPNQPLQPASGAATDALVSGKGTGESPADAPDVETVRDAFRDLPDNLSGGEVLYPSGRAVRHILSAGATVSQAIAQFMEYLSYFGWSTYAQMVHDHDRGEEAAAAFRQGREMRRPETDDPALVTSSAVVALARLEIGDGKGYAGNDLAPGAVAAARAAAPKSGYTHEDTFVLAEVGGIRGGGGYDDILSKLTPQELIDREMQARGRGPSGENR